MKQLSLILKHFLQYKPVSDCSLDVNCVNSNSDFSKIQVFEYTLYRGCSKVQYYRYNTLNLPELFPLQFVKQYSLQPAQTLSEFELWNRINVRLRKTAWDDYFEDFEHWNTVTWQTL